MNKIIMEQQPRKRCNSLPIPRAEVSSQGSPDVKRKYCKEMPASCNSKGILSYHFSFIPGNNFFFSACKIINKFQIFHFVKRNMVNMENMLINIRKNAKKVTLNHSLVISCFLVRRKIWKN